MPSAPDGTTCLICVATPNCGAAKPIARKLAVANKDLDNAFNQLYARDFVPDSEVYGDGKTTC